MLRAFQGSNGPVSGRQVYECSESLRPEKLSGAGSRLFFSSVFGPAASGDSGGNAL